MFRAVVVKATAAMCCQKDDSKANKTAADKIPHKALVRGLSPISPLPWTPAARNKNVARRMQTTPRAKEINLRYRQNRSNPFLRTPHIHQAGKDSALFKHYGVGD